jgi:hypothetical protein
LPLKFLLLKKIGKRKLIMEKNMNRREMLKGIAGGMILSLAGKNVLASDSDNQVSSHPQI